MRDWWARLSRGKKIAIAVLVVAGAPFFIAGAISGAKDSGSKPSSSPAATAAVHQAPPAPEPTFTYPGDPQCAITYRDLGDGTMSWTATTTVAGELITHATDSSGTIYRHDEQHLAGTITYTAHVPLTHITDIGGNLRGTGGRSYGCTVRPAA